MRRWETERNKTDDGLQGSLKQIKPKQAEVGVHAPEDKTRLSTAGGRHQKQVRCHLSTTSKDYSA